MSRKAIFRANSKLVLSFIGSFATYASMIQLDYKLLAIIAICAITGGYIGNFLMHFKLNQKQVKKLLAVMLYILAIKMLWIWFRVYLNL